MASNEVRVGTFPNEMLARYWAGVLEEEGIHSVVKPLMGGYGVLGQTPFIYHGLYVLRENEERALALLDEAQDEEGPEAP